MNVLQHLGQGAGGQVKRNRAAPQEGTPADVLLRYIPVGSVGVGTQIRGLRQFRPKPGKPGQVEEVPAGPNVVVVGPPSSTGIWNLSSGGTLDLSNGAGQPLGVGYFVLVGEITPAEAVAILGGPLPP